MGEVHHLHWQAKVQPGSDLPWDQIVVGIDDIHQAIRIIILSPKLSVPTAPDQFCDALTYIDRPSEIAIPIITQEIWDAIEQWEPRVIMHKVEVKNVGRDHYNANVQWRLREDVAQEIYFTDVSLQGLAA